MLAAMMRGIQRAMLLDACGTTQKTDLPWVSDNDISLVEGTKAAAVYVDHDADFSEFNRVTITDVEVAFCKGWMRGQSGSGCIRRVCSAPRQTRRGGVRTCRQFFAFPNTPNIVVWYYLLRSSRFMLDVQLVSLIFREAR